MLSNYFCAQMSNFKRLRLLCHILGKVMTSYLFTNFAQNFYFALLIKLVLEVVNINTWCFKMMTSLLLRYHLRRRVGKTSESFRTIRVKTGQDKA